MFVDYTIQNLCRFFFFISNMKQRLRQDLFVAAAKAMLLDVPEAKNFITREKHSFNETEFYKAVVQSYKELPSLFPTSGVIRKSKNYGYLALGHNGSNYLNATLRLMTQFDLLGKVGTKSARLVSPPSPVGAHISLRNVQSHDIGKTIHFKLDRIVHFPDERQGSTPSGFNPHVYPIHWFVLNVSGIPAKYSSSYEQPHISIALLAYVK